MTELEWLRDLIERTPVLVVDVAKAEKAGDVAAVSYHHAMARWREEAAQALREAEMSTPAPRKGGDFRVEGLNPWGPLGKFAAHLTFDSPSADASNDVAGA